MADIKDVMRTDIVTLSPGGSVADAINLMIENHIGAILIMDSGVLAGIFTERDVMTKVFPAMAGGDISGRKASDFMTKDIGAISLKTSLVEVNNVMRDRQIRHIPVEDNGKVIGVLSQRDILWKYQEELEFSNAELSRMQAEVLHAARISAMGEIAAGVAHELNQPLMALSTHIEVILMDKLITDNPLIEKKLKQIKSQLQRMGEIVKRLNTFSKKRKEERREEDINVPIQDTLFLMQQQMKDDNISIEPDLAKDMPKLSIDRHQIQDIVINFMVNAKDAICDIYHCKPGGKMKPFSRYLPEEKVVAAGIIDNGKAITEGTEEKLFSSFFTTKDADKGTGIGLSICLRIIKNHNGIISFIKHTNGTKIFYFALPVDRDKPIADEADLKERIEKRLSTLGTP